MPGIKPKKKNRLTTKQPILFYILGLYEFAVKMLNRAHQIFCSDEAK